MLAHMTQWLANLAAGPFRRAARRREPFNLRAEAGDANCLVVPAVQRQEPHLAAARAGLVVDMGNGLHPATARMPRPLGRGGIALL